MKVNYRLMTWDDGQARHAKPDDFPRPDHYEVKKLHHYEAHPDFMWLTEPERRSLVPDQAKVGDSFPVPGAVEERILRFHIHPYNVVGGGFLGLKKDHMRAGELTLTVESASASRVRLRLEGTAKTGLDYDEAQRRMANNKDALGYEPRLLGYIQYDHGQDAITRFDMVAFGEMYGGFAKAYGAEELKRPGRQPMGVSFELADPNVPANRVWPRAACHTVSYFCRY